MNAQQYVVEKWNALPAEHYADTGSLTADGQRPSRHVLGIARPLKRLQHPRLGLRLHPAAMVQHAIHRAAGYAAQRRDFLDRHGPASLRPAVH